MSPIFGIEEFLILRFWWDYRICRCVKLVRKKTAIFISPTHWH